MPLKMGAPRRSSLLVKTTVEIDLHFDFTNQLHHKLGSHPQARAGRHEVLLSILPVYLHWWKVLRTEKAALRKPKSATAGCVLCTLGRERLYIAALKAATWHNFYLQSYLRSSRYLAEQVMTYMSRYCCSASEERAIIWERAYTLGYYQVWVTGFSVAVTS